MLRSCLDRNALRQLTASRIFHLAPNTIRQDATALPVVRTCAHREAPQQTPNGCRSMPHAQPKHCPPTRLYHAALPTVQECVREKFGHFGSLQ